MDDSPDIFLTRKRAIIIITALATTVAFLVGIFLLSIFQSPPPIAQKSENNANSTNAANVAISPTVAPTIQKTPAPTPNQIPSTTPATSGAMVKSTPQSTKEIDLRIKGNRNSMIYHLPGCASYSRTKNNVEWFKTEEEAQAAGYRKARNCW
jgi:hypothetical protein